MRRCFGLILALLILSCSTNEQADLVLINGKIWTGDEQLPWAGWVAVKGGKILQVGTNDKPFAGKATETIDLAGRLMVPGFNDSHVHFASAGHLLLNINLLDVNNTDAFIERVKETTQRLPKGSWITRGDWGAYEAWAMGSAGGDTRKRSFVPHRNLIDSITTDHPVLVTRFDRKMGLANAAALDFLGIDSETGILEGTLLTDALKKIPEKSVEQKLAESRRALEECRRWGVTTVQDMSPPDQLDVYGELRKRGELTCRINFSPSRLIEYEMMKQKGWSITHTTNKQKTAGDEWISFGTLKTHIDGIMGARTAMFFQPYSDNDRENLNWRGSWREFSQDMPSFKEMIIKADEANIQLRIHAIGDMANYILLDILDTLQAVNGPKERRFRLVHAQVIRQEDFAKLRGKNIIAEVQPYHVTDDMRWMEERIGYERCKGAYAFKTLQENGCTLSFGSDWPGTNASYYPVNPFFGLYAAVTRQTLTGEPAEGWFPEQRVSLEEALKAYTYGSAFGAFEETIKGTISPGKLADFAVLDTDLFSTSPDRWLKANVDLTIVGGKIVFSR
jgi:predicted amidohydrolase YtcJ